jgi:hypothetical protein
MQNVMSCLVGKMREQAKVKLHITGNIEAKERLTESKMG